MKASEEAKQTRQEVRRCWEGNAAAWTALARAGYDVYRDWLNTPAFLEMLPEVSGLHGLDVGCGEGHNTRLLAQRGAQVTAIDVSEPFIEYARTADTNGISYCVADAVELPFPAAKFDFACAFMSLMDVPDPEAALAEIYRVLKPGGFLQFSICHPCFDTPHRRNLRGPDGKTYALEVGDYYRQDRGEVAEWLFTAAPDEAKSHLPKFRVPRFSRTLSQWLNALVEIGFVLERMEEPRPSDETVRACHHLQDAQIVAYFLHVRVRRGRD